MKAFNSYSQEMFDPDRLKATVTALADVLPTLMERFDFDTIAVRGKSGIALGFALSMVTGVRVVAVRKGESTHGDMVEGGGNEFARYAFFDDFVASGDTMRTTHEELRRYATSRGMVPPDRVLCIEYGIARVWNTLTYGDRKSDGVFFQLKDPTGAWVGSEIREDL